MNFRQQNFRQSIQQQQALQTAKSSSSKIVKTKRTSSPIVEEQPKVEEPIVEKKLPTVELEPIKQDNKKIEEQPKQKQQIPRLPNLNK